MLDGLKGLPQYNVNNNQQPRLFTSLPTLWTTLATKLTVLLALCIWKYPGVLHGILTTGHG